MCMLLPVGRSGWAIAAGYLGLISVLAFPGPFAMIAGILAIRDTCAAIPSCTAWDGRSSASSWVPSGVFVWPERSSESLPKALSPTR